MKTLESLKRMSPGSFKYLVMSYEANSAEIITEKTFNGIVENIAFHYDLNPIELYSDIINYGANNID